MTTDNDNSAEFTCPTCGAGGALHRATDEGEYKIAGVSEGFERVVPRDAADHTSVRYLNCRTMFNLLQVASTISDQAQAS